MRIRLSDTTRDGSEPDGRVGSGAVAPLASSSSCHHQPTCNPASHRSLANIMSNGSGSRMAVSALLNSDNQSPAHANGHGHHQQPGARLYPSAPFQPSYQSSYTQSSPSNSPFNLRPVTWPSSATARVKEEDSPNRFPHDVHGGKHLFLLHYRLIAHHSRY